MRDFKLGAWGSQKGALWGPKQILTKRDNKTIINTQINIYYCIYYLFHSTFLNVVYVFLLLCIKFSKQWVNKNLNRKKYRTYLQQILCIINFIVFLWLKSSVSRDPSETDLMLKKYVWLL